MFFRMMKKIITLTIISAFLFSLGVLFFQLREQFFPGAYRSMVRAAAARHKIDPLWVAAMVSVESSFKPGAVSSSGAVGLMQLMPSTAEDMARRARMTLFEKKMLTDPAVNLDLGCRYFVWLNNRYDDRHLSLIAYNAGLGNLDRWLVDSGEDPGKTALRRAYPETRKYVGKVKRKHAILKMLDRIWKL